MINIGKPKPKKGQFYHQSGLGQKGWKLDPINYEERRKQFQDEAFHNTLAIHDPLWRYIVQHYKKEIYDFQNIASVNVLGYDSLPIAIELSQWGYPVTFLTDNFEEYEKAKKDCKIQAGKLKDRIWVNYRKNCPRGTVICFIGIIDEFNTWVELNRWLEMLLRRSKEIICAVYYTFPFLVELENDFNIEKKIYPNKELIFLSIKENY